MPTPTQEETENVSAEPAGTILSADELHAGDRVVYPKQGVCRVVGRQVKEIGGMKLEFVALAREEDNASILVPVPKVPAVGLRKLADTAELGDVFDLLASSFDDPELDWKVRHRLHGDLLAAGGILGVAEVLKALQALANLRPLPQKERERYDAARHLLVDEVAVALGVPHATAEDYIDLALIPPPGVERPAARPRRLATLPPKVKRPSARRPHAEDEELELGFEEELDLDEELPPEEEEAEAGESEPEEEEAEEVAPAKPRKAPAAKKAPAAAKAPAAKAARGKAGEEGAPAKRTAKKAEAPAEAAAKPAAKKAAPAMKTAAKKAAAEEKAGPAKKKAAEEKPAAKKSSAAKKPAAAKPKAAAPAKKASGRAAGTKSAAATKTPARKTTRSRKSE